jgi:hypothetical protein
MRSQRAIQRAVDETRALAQKLEQEVAALRVQATTMEARLKALETL